MERRRYHIGYILTILVCAGFTLSVSPAFCERAIELGVGESQVIGQPHDQWKEVTQIVVADPKIADVAPVSATAVVVLGKARGTTMVYAWEKGAKDCYRYKVTVVEPGLEDVARKIKGDLSAYPGVKVRAAGETILLEGTVSAAADVAKVETIAKAHNPNVKNLVEVSRRDVAEAAAGALNDALAGFKVKARAMEDGSVAVEGEVGSKQDEDAVAGAVQTLSKEVRVVNFVRQAPQPTRQVTIRAKVVEVNRGDSSKLGIDWWQTRTGADLPVNPQPFIFGGIGKGVISMVGPIEARIDALIQNNKANLLSEPRMTVMDQETAKILVGGEIPIPMVQSSVANAISIEWKEFGVSLDVTPKIGADDTITLKVAPSVSGLDFANGIRISGFDVPALRTRKAETSVQVKNGETVVIGGLLQTDTSSTVKKIPILGDIPLLGHLFRSTSKEKAETELIIFVTPEIVEAKPA